MTKLFDFRLIITFVFFIYLMTLKGLPGNLHPNGEGDLGIQVNAPPFETSMERGRYAQTISLAESGNINVNEFYRFLKPDLAWHSGNFYSTFPPGVAVLSVPFYELGKFFKLAQIFTFFTSTFFSLLTAYLIYLIARKLGLNNRYSVVAVLLFALASVAWPYSVSYSAHTISSFVLILGVFIAIKSKISNLHFLLLGFLYGTGLFTDYPNLVIFLPVLIFTGITKVVSIHRSGDRSEVEIIIPRGALLITTGFFILFGLFVTYNLRTFNEPLVFSNTYTIKFLETAGIDLDTIELSPAVFENKDYSKRFSLSGAITGIHTLLLSHDRGLLYFSPVFIFSIFGFYPALKKNRKFALISISAFLLNVFLYAAYDDPWGGWAFGPRYLIVTMPLLAVLSCFGLQSIESKYLLYSRLLFFLLLCYSSGVALLGALTTNAIPPSIEAVGIGMSDNYVRSWEYLNTYGTSSFIYKVALEGRMSPLLYAFLLYLVTLALFSFLLFRLKNNDEVRV